MRGPGGTLWGANAVNGVVSVITRPARDTLGGLLAAGGGSEESGFVRARYGARLGGGGHYRALFARITGSEDFDPETVIAYEAGVRSQPSSRLLLDVAAFQNRYPNLLSVQPGRPFAEQDRQIIPFVIANLLEARVRGVELSAHFQLDSSIRLYGGYSFLDMSLTPAPGSTDTSQEDAEGASPRHRLHLRADWTLPRQVDIGLRARWVDELPAERVPAYASLDARVAWRPWPPLELAVVGRDLLSPRHAEFGGGSAGLSQVERAVFAEAVSRW